MMRDPIAQCLELEETGPNLAPAILKFQREDFAQVRNPQRLFVRTGKESSPKCKRQFRNDAARREDC